MIPPSTLTSSVPRSEPSRLNDLLNASGFAFQLAVEAAVRAHPGRLGWRIAAREHPWTTKEDQGFADLVLTCGNVYLVVECKRTRDASWLFLMPDKDQLERSHARIAWIDTVPHKEALAGWDDIQLYPSSPEADFCVVRGQGEKDRPMLERIASEVVAAADGLCADLITIHERSSRTKLVIPVIVTNAELIVGEFDPASIDLARAEVDHAIFRAVPHARFRKSLGPGALPDDYEAEELRDLSFAAVRTVFVVNASGFVAWLNAFQTDAPSASSPWVAARNRANAIGV